MKVPHLCDVLPALTPEQRHEAIVRRAHEKWVKRGCPAGMDLQTWLEAEAEVDADMNRPPDDGAWPHLGVRWRRPR